MRARAGGGRAAPPAQAATAGGGDAGAENRAQVLNNVELSLENHRRRACQAARRTRRVVVGEKAGGDYRDGGMAYEKLKARRRDVAVGNGGSP